VPPRQEEGEEGVQEAEEAVGAIVELFKHTSREDLSSLVGKQQGLFRNAVSMCQRSFSGLRTLFRIDLLF
jgi:hypothetical protein